MEFFSWAFLVLLMKESKKRRQKQPGKLMANSRSQPVNLPVARAGQFAHCPALNESPEPLIELTFGFDHMNSQLKQPSGVSLSFCAGGQWSFSAGHF